MTIKTRIAKLETVYQPDIKQRVCIYYEDKESEGFTVTDGQGKNVEHFATLAELEAYEARPDIDLIVFKIVYASSKPITTLTMKDYCVSVGVDAGKL